MMIEMILIAAIAQIETVDVWFTPNSEGTKVRMSLSHDRKICCYEVCVPSDVASNWDYTGFAPMDWFEDAGMSYQIFDGVGMALGSYPGGAAWDSYTGVVGEFVGTAPLLVDSVVVWDGTIPNYERPVDFWWTCPGDIDGNGAVGIPDFLKLLGDWGLTNDGVVDFLDLIANWGECE